jgi:hypothetical protein
MHTDKIVALLHIYTKYVYLVVCGHIVAAGSAPFFFFTFMGGLEVTPPAFNYYICVRILLYTCPHTTVSSYYYMCPHTTVCNICVLIRLYVVLSLFSPHFNT